MQKIARILFPGLLITVCCIALPLLAATPKDAELLEEVPSPPKVIEGQPIDNPTINKRKDGDNEIEEYSINGDVYMVKVTPPSGKPYYLHREDREGAWVHDGPVRPISVPTWVLFKF